MKKAHKKEIRAQDKVVFFDAITFPVPQEDILRRLGYRERITRFSEEERKKTQAYILEALSLIKLKAAVRRSAFEYEAGGIRIQKNIIFKSGNLSVFLKGCDELLLMGATAGVDIYAAIGRLVKGSEMAKAVVFDAMASEMVDKTLSWLMQFENRQLRRENKILTVNRFSCGYGDLLLENQKKIHKLLDLKKIGVKITKSFILTPEKSVTAIAGIRVVDSS